MAPQTQRLDNNAWVGPPFAHNTIVGYFTGVKGGFLYLQSLGEGGMYRFQTNAEPIQSKLEERDIHLHSSRPADFCGQKMGRVIVDKATGIIQNIVLPRSPKHSEGMER